MRRREFMGLLGGAAVGWPTYACADWTGKAWRVGIVRASANDRDVRELERRLGDLGYVNGKNVVLIDQLTEPTPDAFEKTIASLISSIDLLVVVGTIGAVAARKVVATKPVVFVSVGAPVEIGLVESLARPGGNLTGITFEAATETYAKRLQILKEIMPRLNRVAVLQANGDKNVKFAMASLERAAPDFGVGLLPVGVNSASDLAGAFDEMERSQAEALIVVAGLLTYASGQRIADLALAHRLPSCHAFIETVAVGGLVSLGPNLLEVWGQAAGYIDKIVRGAEPKELPVQQPTRYVLAVNLRTAKALDVTLPQSLIARADEVIE